MPNNSTMAKTAGKSGGSFRSSFAGSHGKSTQGGSTSASGGAHYGEGGSSQTQTGVCTQQFSLIANSNKREYMTTGENGEIMARMDNLWIM